MFTAISLAITAAVEVLLFVEGRSLPGPGFEALGTVISIGFLLAAGSIANLAAGHFAYKRGEYLGRRIAHGGIAFWIATIACAVSLESLLGVK